ncbi:tyrosine-type recombinase/integrase [Hymenobacter sp. B81]|uniref:tyrosine-type recombinase/integrase n=1 Tax=Hymenobacter sp. B81 TaxID=3344878 RepID=UPI0037DC5281
MPATFKIVLAAKADSDGLFDVRLRITVNRVVRYLNTGVAVKAKDWNAKATTDRENWIKGSNHDHSDHNDTLFAWLRRGKKLAQAYPDWSADQLKAALSNGDLDPAAPDFFAFCRRRLAQAQVQVDDVHRRGKGAQLLSQGTIDNRSQVVEEMAKWAARPLPVPRLTATKIKAYEEYLLNEVGNKANTVTKKLGILRTLIRDAIRAGLLTPDKDPMALYEFPRSKVKRVWMSREEVEVLAEAELTPTQHAARVVYFLQYYAHGSRIGAILRLKWKDRRGGRVYFLVDKGTRIKDVEETPELGALLDSLRPAGGPPDPEAYVLPYLPADFERLHPKQQLYQTRLAISRINAALGRASGSLSLGKKLTSHVARRTLATLSERILGGDLRQVGGLLAHTNTRTTQIYLQDLDTHTVDEAARTVYQALSGKTQVKQHPATGAQTPPGDGAENPAESPKKAAS